MSPVENKSLLKCHISISDWLPDRRFAYPALHDLKEFIDAYHNRDINVIIANIKRPVRDLFQRSGLVDLFGKEKFIRISTRLFQIWKKKWKFLPT